MRAAVARICVGRTGKEMMSRLRLLHSKCEVLVLPPEPCYGLVTPCEQHYPTKWNLPEFVPLKYLHHFCENLPADEVAARAIGIIENLPVDEGAESG